MNTPTEEIWKDIPGYEEIYQCSTFGRVKSLNFNKEKILINRKCINGYLYINLYKNNKIKTLTLHRLVAFTFIPNQYNKPCVDHINTIRTDNRVENLKWVTYSENSYNPITSSKNSNSQLGKKLSINHKKRISESHKGKNIKSINQYSKNGEFIIEWNSIINASNTLKINQGNISTCCQGKTKSAGGFIWKYSD